jgi:alkylhydroperoxidase family enzyme
MSARISPVEEPYDPDTAALLGRMGPPGVPPIALFTTWARNPGLAQAVHGLGSYQLSRQLSVGVRDREIVIARTCARCGCAYEWGTHIAFFAERAQLETGQIQSLSGGSSKDACWTSERDRILVDIVDALCERHDLDDSLWNRAAAIFSDAQLLDILALCGWYHAVSFTARATRLRQEPGTPDLAGQRSTPAPAE